MDEIDRAIARIERRIGELDELDIGAAMRDDSAADAVAISNVKEAIREIFGPNSPEFHEHEHIRMWAGGMWIGMSEREIYEAKENGRKRVIYECLSPGEYCFPVISILKELLGNVLNTRMQI